MARGNLGAIEDVYNPGLQWTIRGKPYIAPLASAELGMWCRAVLRAAGAVREAETDEEMRAAVAKVEALPQAGGDISFAERMLGPLHTELVEDGVKDAFISFLAKLVYWWIVNDHDEDEAARFWRSGGRPEAASPTPSNRAERRAAQRTATAAAAATRQPGSTSGTSSRRRSGGKGRARRSPGTGS